MRRFPYLIVSLILGSLPAIPRADFSPLMRNNTWVYSGEFSGPWKYWGSPSSFTFRERLELKILSVRMTPDSQYTWVSMKDSLHHRFTYGDKRPLPDTLVSQTWTYGESLTQEGIQRIRVEGDSLPHFMPDFFIAHTSAGFPGVVSRLDSVVGHEAYRVDTSSGSESQQSWYVDQVGLFWSKETRLIPCAAAQHWLQLESFNGKAVDLGILPPVVNPLPKVGRTGCTEIQPKIVFESAIPQKKKIPPSVNALGRQQNRTEATSKWKANRRVKGNNL